MSKQPQFLNLEQEAIFTLLSDPDPLNLNQLKDYGTLRQQIAENICLMNELADNTANREIPLWPGITGKFKYFLKKIIRKLLRWYIDPVVQQQNAFSHLVVSTFGNLTECIDKVEQEKELFLEEMRTDLAHTNEQVIHTEELLRSQNMALSSAKEQVTTLNDSFKAQRAELNVLKTEFQMLLKQNSESSFTLFNKKSYSQSGEDTIAIYILDVLGHRNFYDISYLDLGANHAVEMSNTYAFYERGAHGVLVEANKSLCNELSALRPRDTVLQRVISDTDDENVSFYILNGDGLSSNSLEGVQEMLERNPYLQIENTVGGKTIRVDTILREYFDDKAPTILSIDVEGQELNIVNSIDFEKYRPLIIIMEMVKYDTTLSFQTKNLSMLKHMEELGYAEYAYTGINSVFVDKAALRK